MAGCAGCPFERLSAVANHFQGDFIGLYVHGAPQAYFLKPELRLSEGHGFLFAKIFAKLDGRNLLSLSLSASLSRVDVHFEGEACGNFDGGGYDVLRTGSLSAGAYLVDGSTFYFVTLFKMGPHQFVSLHFVHKSLELVPLGKGVGPWDHHSSLYTTRAYRGPPRVL